MVVAGKEVIQEVLAAQAAVKVTVKAVAWTVEFSGAAMVVLVVVSAANWAVEVAQVVLAMRAAVVKAVVPKGHSCVDCGRRTARSVWCA